MPDTEKIIALLEEIKQFNCLLIPIFFFLFAITFMVAMRFISWCVEEKEKNDESNYLRLKHKYEKKDK